MRKAFAALGFILIMACNNSECHLFPLNNEYQWTYKTSIYDTAGAVKDTITDTVKIENTIENDGNTYYNLNLLLPLRNKDCNTISLLYDAKSKKEILITNNVTSKQTELFSQPFSGTPADCFVGTKIIGYKDRFKINGHDAFRTDELFTNCQGKVFKKVIIFISEKIGVVQISTYDVLPTGKESLQYVQDLVSYNFLDEAT